MTIDTAPASRANAPSASVVMTTYNSDLTWTAAAIESVLNQTLTDLELIIVDDGSTNGAHDLARQYAQRDARVRPYQLHTNSGGPSRPRNTGIAHARGSFVSFIDSDDLDHPDKLRTAQHVFSSHPDTDLVFSDVYAMSADGVASDTGSHAGSRWLASSQDYLDKLDDDLFQCKRNFIGFMAREPQAFGMSTQTVVVRRQALAGLGQCFPEEFRICEDAHLWFRLAERCRMAYVARPLAYYRQSDNSLSANLPLLKTSALRFHEANFQRIRAHLSASEAARYRRVIANVAFEAGYLLRTSPRESRRCFLKSMEYAPRIVTAAAILKSYLR